jgi:hypothetical protein
VAAEGDRLLPKALQDLLEDGQTRDDLVEVDDSGEVDACRLSEELDADRRVNENHEFQRIMRTGCLPCPTGGARGPPSDRGGFCAILSLTGPARSPQSR